MEEKEVTMDVKTDRSEKIQYNIPGFQASIRKGFLSIYPNYAAVSHWHDDVEFIAVCSGHMLFNINGNILTLQQGEGIFINSRQLHYGFSDDYTECEFIYVLLHPLLLCPSNFIEQEYILPILSREDLPYCLLKPDVEWEGAVLKFAEEIYDCIQERSAPLKIQGLLFLIWKELYDHVGMKQPDGAVCYYNLSTLRDMMAYIQKHYQEKVSLEDIAVAGRVCKSNCCQLFQKFLNQTPITYLTDYRLRKSIDYMRSTDLNITEISFRSGFSGASYYTETFRRYFGCSPGQYRKKL